MDKEIANQLSAMVMNWKKLVNDTQNEIFSGTEAGTKTLFTMINQNKMLRMQLEPLLDVEQRTLRSLYASLIPYAWKLRDSTPVLIDGGFDCDDVGSGDYEYIFPGDNDKAAACVNRKNYFLLNPVGRSTICRQMGNWAVKCENYPMSTLPGFDVLGEEDENTGATKWGGITREDIAHRYVLSCAIYYMYYILTPPFLPSASSTASISNRTGTSTSQPISPTAVDENNSGNKSTATATLSCYPVSFRFLNAAPRNPGTTGSRRLQVRNSTTLSIRAIRLSGDGDASGEKFIGCGVQHVTLLLSSMTFFSPQGELSFYMSTFLQSMYRY